MGREGTIERDGEMGRWGETENKTGNDFEMGTHGQGEEERER